MSRLCPYCECDELEIVDGGALLRCGTCGKSSLPATGGTSDRAARAGNGTPGLAGPPGRVMGQRSAPGEVPSLPAAMMALAATAVFYGLLYVVPSTRFSELFMDRGWVPYVITTISAWALFLLGARALRLRLRAKCVKH